MGPSNQREFVHNLLKARDISSQNKAWFTSFFIKERGHIRQTQNKTVLVGFNTLIRLYFERHHTLFWKTLHKHVDPILPVPGFFMHENAFLIKINLCFLYVNIYIHRKKLVSCHTVSCFTRGTSVKFSEVHKLIRCAQELTWNSRTNGLMHFEISACTDSTLHCCLRLVENWTRPFSLNQLVLLVGLCINSEVCMTHLQNDTKVSFEEGKFLLASIRENHSVLVLEEVPTNMALACVWCDVCTRSHLWCTCAVYGGGRSDRYHWHYCWHYSGTTVRKCLKKNVVLKKVMGDWFPVQQ